MLKYREVEKITQISYINTDRTEFYRPIMKYLYKQSLDRSGDFIRQEEILIYMQSIGCDEYDKKKNIEDMQKLEGWKVVSSIQDTTKPTTIAEGKTARPLYQINGAGRLIEEFLEKLDELTITSGGSLEATAFINLAWLLQEMVQGIKKDDWEKATTNFSNAYQLFENILSEASIFFSLVNQHSRKTITDKEELLAFRNTVCSYLQNFLSKFGYGRDLIKKVLLEGKEYMQLSAMATGMAKYRMETRGEQVEDYNAFIKSIEEKIDRLYSWFDLTSERKFGTSVSFLYRNIREAIRTLMRGIANLLDYSRYYAKRVDEYRKAAHWFASFNDVDNSHMLSAYLFGPVQLIYMKSAHTPDYMGEQHLWKLNGVPEEAITVHNTGARGQKKLNAVADRSVEKQAEAERIRQEIIHRQNMVNELFVLGELVMDDLKDMTLEKLHILLDIIKITFSNPLAYDVDGNLTTEAVAHLPNGKRVRVEMASNELVWVNTEAGRMLVPNFRVKEVS